MWAEIVRIGEISEEFVQKVCSGIEKHLSPVIERCLIGPIIGMPPAAYNPKRQQYDADLIINRLAHRIRGKHKVVAITEFDLYTSSANLNFVFGLAQYPGRCALVSIHRLRPEFYGKRANQNLLLLRSIKECVHELGHTFGLPHCSNPQCVMSFSNSILEVDRKSAELCRECWRELDKKTVSLEV